MPEKRSISQRAISKVLQQYWRRSRGLSLSVRGLVFDKEGQVLLVQRAGEGDNWSLPGGDVHKGEGVGDAIARHLAGDARITITQPAQLAGILANFTAGPSEHLALLVVQDWSRAETSDGAPRDRSAQWKFFASAALPANICASSLARIREHLANDPQPPHW